jgi:hypothetical protein
MDELVWIRMSRVALFFLIAMGWSSIACASDQSEITLFDSRGKPIAYIAPDEELSIYLWDGTPAAYLEKDGGRARRRYASVYGFNGKHLGWFSDGLIRDHSGSAACAVQQRMGVVTSIEPVKGVKHKHIEPVKAVPEISPVPPVFMDMWGNNSCRTFLSGGLDQ